MDVKSGIATMAMAMPRFYLAIDPATLAIDPATVGENQTNLGIKVFHEDTYVKEYFLNGWKLSHIADKDPSMFIFS